MWGKRILENSTKYFCNVFVSDVFGTPCFSILKEDNKLFELLIPELKGNRIIDSYYNKNYLIVMSFDGKKYNRNIFKLSNNCTIENKLIISDVNLSEINATVSDAGHIILAYEDEILLTNCVGTKKIKGVANLGSLEYKFGDTYVWQGNKLNLIKMR